MRVVVVVVGPNHVQVAAVKGHLDRLVLGRARVNVREIDRMIHLPPRLLRCGKEEILAPLPHDLATVQPPPIVHAVVLHRVKPQKDVGVSALRSIV